MVKIKILLQWPFLVHHLFNYQLIETFCENHEKAFYPICNALSISRLLYCQRQDSVKGVLPRDKIIVAQQEVNFLALNSFSSRGVL